MTLTVDLVIVGMTDAAAAAATDAVRRGQRVLVVGESKDTCYCRSLRRAVHAAGDGCRERLSTLAGFEVVSVDGMGGVEVVLVRNVKTGGLIGINAGALLATTALAPGIVVVQERACISLEASERGLGHETGRSPGRFGGRSEIRLPRMCSGIPVRPPPASILFHSL